MPQFPANYPGEWFGFGLLGHLLSGVTAIFIAMAMVAIFTIRRKLVAVHSLPLFAGLVLFFFASGVGDLFRFHILMDAGKLGVINWSSWQEYRMIVLLIQGASGIWCLASLMQQWPFMRSYVSDESLRRELEELRTEAILLHRLPQKTGNG